MIGFLFSQNSMDHHKMICGDKMPLQSGNTVLWEFSRQDFMKETAFEVGFK